MTEYDNNNRGALFQSKDKKTDKHPDYTGKAEVNGEEMFLSAWKNTSKKGEVYLSISFAKPMSKDEAKSSESSDVDIPF